MSEIRIKERIATSWYESDEIYTPESIRETWSGSTAEDCLVLALLEKWEDAEKRLAAVIAALSEACSWIEARSTDESVFLESLRKVISP